MIRDEAEASMGRMGYEGPLQMWEDRSMVTPSFNHHRKRHHLPGSYSIFGNLRRSRWGRGPPIFYAAIVVVVYLRPAVYKWWIIGRELHVGMLIAIKDGMFNLRGISDSWVMFGGQFRIKCNLPITIWMQNPICITSTHDSILADNTPLLCC
jgi:hypothetical protein